MFYLFSVDTDRDFDPSADMLVHEYDDETTLDDEEAMSSSDGANELDDLQKVSIQAECQTKPMHLVHTLFCCSCSGKNIFTAKQQAAKSWVSKIVILTAMK